MKQTFVLRPGETAPESRLMQWLVSRDREKPWKVEVSEYRKNRSLEQNAYYWSAVLPTMQSFIEESRGDHYSCDEIHEYMRDDFLPHRVITIKGQAKVVRPSTASLTTEEFSVYLEHVIHFAAESGIVIPAPEWREK